MAAGSILEGSVERLLRLWNKGGKRHAPPIR